MTSHPIRLPGFVFREPEDDGDRKLLSDVESHGWHVVAVPSDDQGPGFAFTVGLYLRTLQPEILIMGIPPDPSCRVLNAIGDYAMAGGEIVAGRRYPRLVDRCDVEFRSIAPQHFKEYFGCAIWFYRRWSAGFPTMQCIYPDLEGVFPGEAGHAQRFKELQWNLSNGIV
jgi:hypothetical protein